MSDTVHPVPADFKARIGPEELAALVRAGQRRFLVHGNYDALLRYNCHHHYALAVALLADRIGETP